MTAIQLFITNRFPAVVCIALAMLVMVAPAVSQSNANHVAIENTSSGSGSEKDVILIQNTVRTAEIKYIDEENLIKLLSFSLKSVEAYKQFTISTEKDLPVHGSFRFLHMLKLF